MTTRALRGIAPLVALLATCSQREGHRALPGTEESSAPPLLTGSPSYVSFPSEGYSTLVPRGWSYRRERGITVFTSPRRSSTGTATVFVQPANHALERARKQTPEAIMAATERAIRLLPAAKVTSHNAIKRGEFTGVEFDLSYRPSTSSDRRYDRKHVILAGKRVFHVVHTAPEGQLRLTAAEFESVLQNLREEG